MKKIIFFLFFLLINLLYIQNTNWLNHYWCSQYWFALATIDWKCECMSWYRFWKDFMWETKCISSSTYCRDTYWWNSRSNINDECVCNNWYHFETTTSLLWKKVQCVKNKSCSDIYWFWATENFSWNCICRNWYIWWEKYWKDYCIDWYSFCTEKYWYNISFNQINNSCECNYWYIIKDWKCEKKHNSAYFFLSEYNDDKNQAIVISYTTKKVYLIELRYTIRLYKAEDFIWKSIVINMWTDFDIDRYDKFILNNQTKTTDIVVDIIDVEEVDEDFTLKTCQEIFWNNAIDTYDNKCICKTGYKWNYNNTSCDLDNDNISNTNYTISNSNISNVNLDTCGLNSYKNSDWKCSCLTWYKWIEPDNNNNLDCIKNTVKDICPDYDNVYLWNDNKCYCNDWYIWNDNKYNCIQKVEESNGEICKEKYWVFSVSDNIKNEDWVYWCVCMDWYILSKNWTSCITKKTYDLEQQSEKLFIKINKIFSKYSKEKKELTYTTILKKIEEIKITANSDLIIMLDHLKFLINEEIWIDCDEVMEALGICKVK